MAQSKTTVILDSADLAAMSEGGAVKVSEEDKSGNPVFVTLDSKVAEAIRHVFHGSGHMS